MKLFLHISLLCEQKMYNFAPDLNKKRKIYETIHDDSSLCFGVFFANFRTRNQ